jgi:hypothetical protein
MFYTAAQAAGHELRRKVNPMLLSSRDLATFVAALTRIPVTPMTAERAFSIAGGQCAQVMPPMRSSRCCALLTACRADCGAGLPELGEMCTFITVL